MTGHRLLHGHIIWETGSTKLWPVPRDCVHMFGGCPVVNNTGKIINVEIGAYEFVAEFFEEIQTRIIRAFRRNNLKLTGKKDEDLDDGIKNNVAEFPPESAYFLAWLLSSAVLLL